MKKFIKNFAYVLTLISVATMVSGCSTRKSQTTEAPKVFTIWSFESEDTWKPVIKDLQKELGGYEIKYVQKKLDDTYENDALNSIMSGQGPDIWAMPNDWIYRHKDKLEPAPDSVYQDLKIDDYFVPAIKESCVFEEKLYSISPFVDSLMVYYNQSLFDATAEEYANTHRTTSAMSESEKTAIKNENQRVSQLLQGPPNTWTGFAESVRLITKKSGADITRSGVAMGTSANIKNATNILYAMMLQNGTQMTSKDLQLATFSLPQNANTGLPDAPAKRAIDFYTSFSNPASENYAWNSAMPSDIDAFAQGKVAMIFASSSLASYYSQYYPNFKYKKAPIPQIGDNNTNVVDYGFFYAYSVPKLSQNIKAAWGTISMIGKDDYGFSSTLRLPSSKKDKNFLPNLIERSGNSNPGKIQSQTAKLWTKGRYPQETEKIFSSTINEVVANPVNSQALLDTAAVNVTNLLKKTDW